MVVAMFAGMGAGSLIFAAVGLKPSFERSPEPAFLLMAFTMSVGMVVLMRLRGHRWPAVLEMCGAMFAPAPPLLPLLWLGVIDGATLMVVAHAVMFPLMFAVMLRRRAEYTRHPHRGAR